MRPPADPGLRDRACGLMFHHFHGPGHPCGQGAISADDLAAIIEFVGPGNILSASQWLSLALAGQLRPGQHCLTFDDTLLCQYELALPVLRDYGLTAFWFVYTSPLEGKTASLEIYRYFRTVHFGGIEEFYAAFHAEVARSPHAALARRGLEGFEPGGYLPEFTFYTDSDRVFRYLRDVVLGESRYDEIMGRMMEAAGVDARDIARRTWMTAQGVRGLHQAGHVLGLHTHNHPTRVGEMGAAEQEREYRANLEHLQAVTGHRPVTMSHPCNSYNADTVRILRELGVKLGFVAVADWPQTNEFEHPRIDHAHLMAALRHGQRRALP